MKTIKKLSIKKLQIVILYLTLGSAVNAQIPFSRGVNLTGWFQAGSPSEIHFTRYTKNDFENIKSLGANVIRLPVNLHAMTSGAPGYEPDPLFLNFLDKAADWAEELGLYLIIDNHTFDPVVSTSYDIGLALIPVWQKMAGHLKDRSELIIYEILNEPHGISDIIWNDIQKDVVEAIREIDTVHYIVVGPTGWNSYNNLSAMPEYNYEKLIYTFHFYDPFIFTHQGASWTDPSLVPLSGVPFPFNPDRMPSVPAELSGTWVEQQITGYNNNGTISKVREALDIAVNFMNERNVTLFCGEFGVYMNNSDNNDRILWYNVVRTYLESKGIAWTTWDYHGGFGLFEKNSAGMFEHDLNTGLAAALGFVVPPQTDPQILPDSLSFGIYNDYIEGGIDNSSYSAGPLNFYEKDSYNGEFCINWENPEQYNTIGFTFLPYKDLSYLSSVNAKIGFWVKSSNPNARFQVRFLDTKENEEDLPWRIGVNINNTMASFNGGWEYLEFPLLSLNELGAWDNTWYEPEGKFDWSKTAEFEIVDEFGALSQTSIQFDDINVFTGISRVEEDGYLQAGFRLYQNYPNPFNAETRIRYRLIETAPVSLVVYDILGRKVKEIVKETQTAGEYTVNFIASGLPSGLYIYRLLVSNYSTVRTMILLK